MTIVVLLLEVLLFVPKTNICLSLIRQYGPITAKLRTCSSDTGGTFAYTFLSFYKINYRVGGIITKYKVTYLSGESNVEFVDFRDIATDMP